jgi:hypothetical protein
MKPFATLCVLLLAFTASAPDALSPESTAVPPLPAGTAPSRFVLFSHGGSLYRIDTATGRTWEHVVEKTSSRKFPVVSGWLAMNENYFAVLKMTADLDKPAEPPPAK